MTEIKMENGRSMVEMLGVLAVAGVLSIGGVAGYRYAIDKMNANDIINEVKKRAVTASQQRILGHDINLSEYGDNGRIKGIHAVTATNDYAGDKGFFALTVSAVPQRVCDEILKQDWAMPVETAVGGVVVDDDTACAAGDNEMLFAFANTLDNSHLPGEGGEDDGDDEVDDGDDPWAQECGTNEYHDPETGICTLDEKCPEGRFWANISEGGSYHQSCYPCSYEASNIEDVPPEACAKCSNRMMTENGLCVLPCNSGQFRSSDGYCYPCSLTYGVIASSEECNKCGGTRYMTDTGYCVVQSCSDEEFMTSFGSCEFCSYILGVGATKEECDKCSNRFRDSHGTCWSCSWSAAKLATAEECAKCGGTRHMTDTGYCALTSCGSGKFMSIKGDCFPCSRNGGDPATAEECAKCSNRVMTENGWCAKPCNSGQFIGSYGSCYSCSSNSAYRATAEGCAMCNDTDYPRYLTDNGYCALISCPSGYFANTNGTCYSCSYSSSISSVAAKECAKCSNRVMTDTGDCALSCGSDEFRGNDASCYSCSYTSSVAATLEECIKCEARYLTEGGYCALPCQNGEFMGSDGVCYSCSYDENNSMAIQATPEECAKCGDERYIYGDYCYKK